MSTNNIIPTTATAPVAAPVVPSQSTTSDALVIEQVPEIEQAVTEKPISVADKEEKPVITAEKPTNKVQKEEDDIDAIRVVHEDPMPTNISATRPEPGLRRSSSINPSAILESTIEGLATISSKINPITQKLGKGLGQVRQFAQEKFGTAEDITVLPEEYKELEKRVDTIAQLHQNFLKVAKTYNTPNYDYPVQIQESIKGFTHTVTNQIQQLRNKPELSQTMEEHPRTLSHAIARVATQGAADVGKDEALGVALDKLGDVSNKLGDARLTMDHEIVSKFNTPIQVTLKTAIEGANKARRNVQLKRLALDAAKTNYRESPTAKLDEARAEVEQAEDQFVGAVEEATHLMKAILEDPEPLRDLAEYAQVQLQFFKQAQDLFSGLVPELEEIRVTQESIYRDSREH